MQIQTLSITLGQYCNANCPFCISKTTYNVENDKSSVTLMKNIDKALRFAVFNNINTVLITSKGEATLYKKELLKIIKKSAEYHIPIIEIQSNGSIIDEYMLQSFYNEGLTGIALSVCSSNPIESNKIMNINKDYNYWKLVENIVNMGFLCRLSVMLIKGYIDNIDKCKEFLSYAEKYGVHQITFREIGKPKTKLNNQFAENVSKWIDENKVASEPIINFVQRNYVKLRELSWGASVYDCNGISVCVSDCMAQKPEIDNIRTVILQADGHLYHSWEYTGSILL